MKIVLDTNVLVSATLWKGSSAQKFLSKAISSNIEIFLSKDIIAEYYEVVQRDFNYPEEKAIAALENVLSAIKIIEATSKINIITSDPDDNKILECAVDSSSDYIISYDKHLLTLKEYKGIKIIKPEDLQI